MVPGGRGGTQREDELQRQVEDDSAQGPVVRAKKAPSEPSMDDWDGHLAAEHAEYPGWCPFCVAGKGKSEAHRLMEASRDLITQSFLWTVPSWVVRPRGQVLEGSLVGHSSCAVQGYSASVDRRQARE